MSTPHIDLPIGLLLEILSLSLRRIQGRFLGVIDGYMTGTSTITLRLAGPLYARHRPSRFAFLCYFRDTFLAAGNAAFSHYIQSLLALLDNDFDS
jgi:hypothetical protein